MNRTENVKDRTVNRIACEILLGLNCAAFAAGILCLACPDSALMGQAFGSLFIAAIFCNSAECAFDHRTGTFAIVYLLFTATGFLLLPFLLLVRASLSHNVISSLSGYAVVFGSLGFGVVLSKKDFRGRPLRRKSRPAFATGSLGVGIVALAITVRFLAGPHPRTAGVLVPQCLPYWAFGFLSLGALSVRLFRFGEGLGRGSYLAGFPAVAAAFLAFLPVYQVPTVVRRAESDFAAQFGVAAEDVTAPGLQKTPFSLGRMLLGSNPGRARSRLNVPFLTETASNGRSYTFRYDQWSPAEGGTHPVLIRIHGGAWISGDKGCGNMNTMNRHFASLGYVVFDLQYGLNESATFAVQSPTPASVVGPFSIDDMVRQIGAFSSYLADRSEELGADIHNVFLSGGSAGGHLALALALTQTSGYLREHPGIGLDTRLTVRGVLPFYPAVGYPRGMGIPSSPALDDISVLLSPESPPVLIYQGGRDGMVDPERIHSFARKYRTAAGRAALIEFPSAGHGSDIIFWNCYNQVFLYYMERFMSRMESSSEARKGVPPIVKKFRGNCFSVETRSKLVVR